MNKYLLIGILVTFISLSFKTDQVDHKEIKSLEVCDVNNQAFENGEVIVYKLYYNWNFIWLSAGEVVFRVNEMEDHFKLTATGRTYSSYEWFFKVRDYFESRIDKETLLPTLSIRDVHEGSYTRYDKVIFDQDRQDVFYQWGKSKEDSLRQGRARLDGCMHDILSILYCLRNVDLSTIQTGETFPIEVFLDKEVWPLQVEVKAKSVEKRIKGKGKLNTLHFSPEVVAGSVFKEGDRMHIYVSDDKNRIPLLIETPVSVGSIKAVASNWYGLKYPLNIDE